MTVVPLQLKIKNFYGKIHTYTNSNRVMPIHNDDKELFRKCREIWNKITELIGINNAKDFVETTFQMMVMNLLWQMYTKIQALLAIII